TPPFLEQPENAIQTMLAHPSFRLSSPARDHVKRSSHTHNHGNIQFVPVLLHPAHLSQLAQPDPDHVGRGARDQRNSVVIVVLLGAHALRIGSGNSRSRTSL